MTEPPQPPPWTPPEPPAPPGEYPVAPVYPGTPGHPGAPYPAPLPPAMQAPQYPAPGPGQPYPPSGPPVAYPPPGPMSRPVAYPGHPGGVPAYPTHPGGAPVYPGGAAAYPGGPPWPPPIPPPPGPVGTLGRPARIDPVPGTDFGIAYLAVNPTFLGLATGSIVAGIGAALVAFVVICLGIAGAGPGWGALVSGAFAILSALLGGAAIAAGLIALGQIRAAAGRLRGRGPAISGIWCGGGGLVLAAFGFLLALILS
ncbi:hypothetical protein GCM10023322_04390 [Rugosimonospora acidiphila]|uniref:DUF4190 domain-containing protein n=1 Tax=Rugosimonospora acidiphila TaxID=556531 RepID=A0ABP9RJ44_9ACTN